MSLLILSAPSLRVKSRPYRRKVFRFGFSGAGAGAPPVGAGVETWQAERPPYLKAAQSGR